MRAEELEQFVERLKNEVMNNFPLKELSDNELREKIENLVEIRLANVYVSIEQRVAIAEQIYSSIRGFGLLDSIMTDDNITEVMINGPKNIFVEEAGKVRKIERTFESERKLRDVIQRIVAQAGREVTEANPIVDTRLPNGSRVNVVLPPISLNGSIVTIRKFSKEPMTMKKLIEYGSLNEGIASLLELLIQARYNIFVCGGTG